MLRNRQSTGSAGKTNQEKDEFAALNLDRLKKSELKTQEQVRRHSIDAYLESRVIDRALHILSAGEEIQKISVVKDLPSLLEEDPAGCLQRVIPRMQQTLPSGSMEYNMAACTAVKNIAGQKLISHQEFTKNFLQVLLNSVESPDTVASDAWISTLLDVIDVLPSNILQTEVLPVFASKAHISKPVRIRIISCKILGRLAALLPTPVVTKDILPVIISLCQDPYGKVRASMCQELPCISQLVGQEDSNKYLLNCILDLANDEDSSVKEASLDSIAQLIPFIPLSSIKSLVIPLTKKLFLQSIEAEDGLIVSVAHFFGQYCIRLKDYLPLTDKAWFVARYVHLSQLNTTNRKKSEDYRLAISSEEEELNQRLTQCRVKCAYNFPAMVAFTADLKPEFSEKLPVVLKNLSSDSYFVVRKSIACGFHELFKLQPKWISLLTVIFMKFLKDENENVLVGLAPNIGKILSIICEGPTFDKREAAQSLLTCEKMLFDSMNWRLHSDFLAQLQIIPKCFPPDFVNQTFVSLFMQRSVSCRQLPCKVAAVKIILLIMSDEAQAKQKHKMRSQLLELCNSFNFYSRIVFVHAITLLIDISPKILKELFFHNIIAMTEDKVPNIRLAVCKIMPKLKAIAFDPYDRRLIAALESSVRRLGDEKDKDVLEQIRIMNFELDELDRSKKGFRTNRDSDISNPSALSSSFSKHIPQTPFNPMLSDQSPVLRSRSVPPAKGLYPVTKLPTAPSTSLPSRIINTGKPVPASRPLAKRK